MRRCERTWITKWSCDRSPLQAEVARSTAGRTMSQILKASHPINGLPRRRWEAPLISRLRIPKPAILFLIRSSSVRRSPVPASHMMWFSPCVFNFDFKSMKSMNLTHWSKLRKPLLSYSISSNVAQSYEPLYNSHTKIQI